MTTYYAYLEEHIPRESNKYPLIRFAPSAFDMFTKSYDETPNYIAEDRKGFETIRDDLKERGIKVRIDALPFGVGRVAWAIGGEVTRTPIAEIPEYNLNS